MITLEFKAWNRFKAELDRFVIAGFLHDLSENSIKAFRKDMTGPHSGRTYYRKGGAHRASAPGEFPATESGALMASIDTEVRMGGNAMSVTIGTNTAYAGFLADGTSRMAKRKMSKEALIEGIKMTHFTKSYARFKR